ncbi:D-alanyl-D-alanine carboxypeptidase [Streptomyces prasinus]
MEEASVAGESPDRSKQRESSAEPTPGSSGPVPEARNEGGAAGQRDPRAAVTRGASSPSSPKASDADVSASASSSSEEAAASAGGRGGVDTATRVLSARDTRTEDEEAEDSVETEDAEGSVETASSGPAASDSGPTDGAPGGRGDSAAEGDEQVHAVVSAWVRSAEEADEDRDEGGEGTRGAQEAENTTGGDPGTERGPEDGKGGSAGRDEGAGGASEGGATGDAGATEESGRSGEPDGADAVDAGDESGSAHDTDVDTDTGSDAGPEADAATAPEDEVAPAAEDDGNSNSEGPGGDGDNSDDTDASPEAEPEAKSGAAKAASVPSTDEADDTDTDGGTDGGSGSDNGEGAGGAKPPTDQPTAVFKAPRPSAPAVDQPTTMLKWGDAAKDAVKNADEAKEAAKDADKADGTGKAAGKTAGTGKAVGKAVSVDRPDSGDEDKSAPDSDPRTTPGRTGTFVPLKDPDAPETRKPPKRTDSATTSLRLPSSARAQPAAPPADGARPVPPVGPELTRQQPLPPKPPLDLLAELTNTPPPPDTPLRTTLRRVKIWTPLVALLVIAFAVVQNMRALPVPTLELTAEDTFTFDGGKVDIPWPADGQAALDVQGIGTFGSSGEQKPVPIASVAKVMTTYLILREHPLKSGAEGPMIKIDDPAEEQSDAGDESTVDVTSGDEISQREALEAVLIASANNVARLVARWDAGSEEAFVEKMNKTAEELGMTNTTYTDPSGLNNTTVSTAVDQVKLGRAAMKQPAFREIAAMMSYDDYKGKNHPNWNQLVGSNGVVGIKTGTTTSALGNLTFAAKKDVDGQTRTIVGAVVRQPAGGADNTILAGALSAGDRLIRAAQDALETATVLKKGSVVGYVDDGLGGRTPVALTEDVEAVGWPGLKVKLTFTGGELPHRAKAGTEVGSLTVGDGTDSGAVKVPVALQQDLVEPDFTDKLTRIA